MFISYLLLRYYYTKISVDDKTSLKYITSNIKIYNINFLILQKYDLTTRRQNVGFSKYVFS